MAWVKMDDQFFRHPKVLAAGRDARDLYLVGLCYCAQGLTDGFIPSQAVRVLAAEAEIDTGPASAARLVEVGLWESIEGGYAVHDYHEYQPSKERVLATREARAEAGSRGGKQKASNLLSKNIANEKQKSAPYPSRTPSPSRTQVDPPEDLAKTVVSGALPLADAPTPAPKGRAKGATPTPDMFPITDEMRDWADENAPGVDVDHQTQRFLNRNRAEGKTYKDWLAAWRNWITSPYSQPTARAPAVRAIPTNGKPTGRTEGMLSDDSIRWMKQRQGAK